MTTEKVPCSPSAIIVDVASLSCASRRGEGPLLRGALSERDPGDDPERSDARTPGPDEPRRQRDQSSRRPAGIRVLARCIPAGEDSARGRDRRHGHRSLAGPTVAQLFQLFVQRILDDASVRRDRPRPRHLPAPRACSAATSRSTARSAAAAPSKVTVATGSLWRAHVRGPHRGGHPRGGRGRGEREGHDAGRRDGAPRGGRPRQPGAHREAPHACGITVTVVENGQLALQKAMAAATAGRPTTSSPWTCRCRSWTATPRPGAAPQGFAAISFLTARDGGRPRALHRRRMHRLPGEADRAEELIDAVADYAKKAPKCGVPLRIDDPRLAPAAGNRFGSCRSRRRRASRHRADARLRGRRLRRRWPRAEVDTTPIFSEFADDER